MKNPKSLCDVKIGEQLNDKYGQYVLFISCLYDCYYYVCKRYVSDNLLDKIWQQYTEDVDYQFFDNANGIENYQKPTEEFLRNPKTIDLFPIFLSDGRSSIQVNAYGKVIDICIDDFFFHGGISDCVLLCLESRFLAYDENAKTGYAIHLNELFLG